MADSFEEIASLPQPSNIHQLYAEPPAQNPAPVQPAQAQPPVAPPQPPAPSKPECKYKNYLQEYTQREGLLLPSYHTVWDGASHSPMFRSTVVVNGVTYSSPNVFPTRKAAEMDVAGIALRGLLQLQQAEDCSIDKEELTLCKAILKEYADKINVGNPIYKTEQGDGSSAFISSLTFNGKEYVGEAGRNKKESQHLAARAVIMSVLDTDARGVISKIIKSKRRMVLPAKGNVSNPFNAQNVGNPAGIQTISNVVCSAIKENEPVVVNDNMVKTATQEPCIENSSSALAEPISLVEASATLNLEQLLGGSTSSKKRKRKNKKADKNVESDAQVQVAATPSSQNTASADYSDQICPPNSCASLPGSDNAVLLET
ncbi:hypothetical protein ACET3Z_027045 [Daucus carota]